MSRYWSDTVHNLKPYVAGEQPKLDNLVKLNTNENPYGPSPRVIEAIRAAADDDLRLYPDPDASRLKSTIANYHSIAPDQVILGNSSDEVLSFAFQALLKHDTPLLFPDVTYSFYPSYCALYGIDYATVALNENFEIEIADYRHAKGGIIFANPNAPTGHLLNLDAIERLLANNPDSPVVVDEAYIDFGGITAISLIDRHPNLLVVQTLSKSRSLAGLRVGFAAGCKDLIIALQRVKNSFNAYPLDRLAQAGAIAAFEDREHFNQTRAAVIFSREKMSLDLQNIGFEVLPSAANFVFARHSLHDAGTLAKKLRERSIIVRHFKLPRIDQFLRISVGTDPQGDALITALEKITA